MDIMLIKDRNEKSSNEMWHIFKINTFPKLPALCGRYLSNNSLAISGLQIWNIVDGWNEGICPKCVEELVNMIGDEENA